MKYSLKWLLVLPVYVATHYAKGIQTGEIQLENVLTNGDRWYYIKDADLAEWFDTHRAEMIRQFNVLCAEAGLQLLVFPRSRGRRGY